MTTQFARESLTPQLWQEAMPLLEAHYREIAAYQDIPLEPDVSVYAASEAAGAIRCYTARAHPMYKVERDGPMERVDDGVLVGYALFFVRANPHYSSSVQAVQDVVYLHPAVRGGTGYKFIAWCDEQLRAEGVQAVYHHVKAAHNFGRLLERQGYELVDLIYAKRLDRPAPVDRPSAVEALDEAFV